MRGELRSTSTDFLEESVHEIDADVHSLRALVVQWIEKLYALELVLSKAESRLERLERIYIDDGK